MKFFVPATENEAQAEKVLSSIKKFLEEELGAVTDTRRIFNLLFIHNGKQHYAEIGKFDDVSGEPIIAILHEPKRQIYHICTPNRGVLRGMSILVGAQSVRSSEDFEL